MYPRPPAFTVRSGHIVRTSSFLVGPRTDSSVASDFHYRPRVVPDIFQASGQATNSTHTAVIAFAMCDARTRSDRHACDAGLDGPNMRPVRVSSYNGLNPTTRAGRLADRAA